MLECKGTVKMLPPAADGDGWVIKLAAGSRIPYVESGGKRIWCMEVFQNANDSSSKALVDEPPNLDLNTVVAMDDKSDAVPGTKAPIAEMPGLKPAGDLNKFHQTF